MLSELKHKQLIWLANERILDKQTIKTGYIEFDSHYLGLPLQGLIELQSRVGSGEIRFLANYLKHKQEKGIIAVVHPPGLLTSEFLLQQGFDLTRILLIFPDSMANTLWATEQCLKSGLCSAVLLWQETLTFKHTRRINLACEKEGSVLILMRSIQNTPLPSCKLSLQLQFEERGLRIKVKKQKGRKLSNSDPLIKFESLWPDYLLLFRQESCLKSATFGS